MFLCQHSLNHFIDGYYLLLRRRLIVNLNLVILSPKFKMILAPVRTLLLLIILPAPFQNNHTPTLIM